jgi:hypothetical protein
VAGFTLEGQTLFRVHTSGGPDTGVFGTPVATDLDNDGKLEVIATTSENRVHAWRLDGSELPGFPVYVQDTIWSSPSVADIDGDGYREIVFGYDCDGAPGQACSPNYGGYLGVLRHDGAGSQVGPSSSRVR